MKSVPKLAGLWRCARQGLALVLLVGALVGGLILAGRWGLEQIRGQERYVLRFADIDTTPPPGMERGAFLDEVLYFSRLPNRLELLDDELSSKIAAAFAMHPWVEKVDGVVLAPPRCVQVRLTIRRPVLAVYSKEEWSAVDGNGVRLPKSAPTEGLPVYERGARPPQGPPGTTWGDPNVEERAREAKKEIQGRANRQ